MGIALPSAQAAFKMAARSRGISFARLINLAALTLLVFGFLGGLNATSDVLCGVVSWGVAAVFLIYLITLLAL